MPALHPSEAIVLREMAILVANGTAIYIWLSALCAPLLSIVPTIARDPLHARAWRAAGLASAIVVLWTTIMAASMLLLATLAPRTALAMLESPVRDVALLAGGALWLARTAWIGLPRLGTDTEIASALAVVSLFRDDLETLRSAEALYRERVLSAPAVSGRNVRVRVAPV